MRSFARFPLGMPLLSLMMAVVLFSPSASAQTPKPLSTPHLDLLVEGAVFAVARQPNGGIVIGGDFSHVNGVRRERLARLLPSGALDPAWNPEVDGNVYTLAVDADGDIYVGGSFRRLDGVERNHLAKVSGAGDGQVDAVWNPILGPIFQHVMALAVDAQGAAFVGGSFAGISGEPRQNLAKILPTGEVDPDWSPGSFCSISAMALDHANNQIYVAGCFDMGAVTRIETGGFGQIDPLWAPTPNGGVDALAIHDDSIFIAGGFSHIGGEDVRILAKVSMFGTGGADPFWQPVTTNAPPTTTVGALAVDPAGYLYVGGEFEEIGGAARKNAARIDMDGLGASDLTWNPGFDARVRAIQPLPAGGVVVAGNFSAVGTETRWGLAMIDDAGAVADREISAGRTASALAMVRQSDGGLILGGRFKAANGVLRNNLVRLQPNGLLDEDWSPSVDDAVYTLAVDANDDVFVGGAFSAIDGHPRHYLAKVAGHSGAVDPIWNPAADNIVGQLVVHGGGIVIAAGGFEQMGGLPRNGLAKLSSTGSGLVDPLWDPSPGFSIYDMVVSESGALYVGGPFNAIGGHTRRGLAKLSIHGSGEVDVAWNPAPASGHILVGALALDTTGHLYVGGSFSNMGGQARSRLAKLASDGTGDADPAWNPSSDGHVMGLIASDDGRIYVSGSFTQINGQPHQRLARLSQDGSGLVDPDWRPFAPYNNSFSVNSVVADELGRKVYIAGDIKVIGDVRRHGFAAFNDNVDTIFFNAFE